MLCYDSFNYRSDSNRTMLLLFTGANINDKANNGYSSKIHASSEELVKMLLSCYSLKVLIAMIKLMMVGVL